ncbi:translocation/assembly module TamB domain-containing protein [Gilvimarinus polysaccharolyticus]|uniref:translocation/assembly module TamB domain-containing protein n=1 Tax=Gilvimarinus polysaccharolyticus TaxID=863921 RepID=UPI0006738C69|nr:translocation/assembly module TamB domain-containing protein [Gilvimarinus polysaccharolyticus]
MIKRLFLRGLLSLAITLMTIVSVATLVLATEPGTRWLLDQVRGATALNYQTLNGNLLTGMNLQHVQYSMLGGEYRADSIELSWHPAGVIWGALVIDQLAVSGLDIRIATQADTNEPKAAPRWPELSLPIAIVVRDLILERGYVAINDRAYYLEAAHASARYGPSNIVVDGLSVRTAASTANLSGSAALSYPYAFEAQLGWDLQPLAADTHENDVLRLVPPVVLENTLRGHLSLSGDLASIKVNATLARPAKLSLAGQYLTGIDDRPANIEAEVSWPQQSLAALGIKVDALLNSEVAGRLSVNGWLDDYQANLAGSFIHPKYPPLALNVDLNGDTQHLILQDSTIQVAGANLQTQGRLDWADGLDWDVAVNAKHIDPQVVLEGWPGDLQAQLISTGRQNNGALNVAVNIKSLTGRLRALALNGRGAVTYNMDGWQFTDVVTTLGANRVAVNGSLSELYDIAWDIQAPILAQIDPSLGGSLTAHGQLSGTIANPKIKLSAEGQELHWQDYQVASINVQSNSDDIKKGRLGLIAEARDLRVGDIELAALSTVIDGSAEQHTLSLSLVQDAQNDVQLALAGGWNGERWQGYLEQLQLRSMYAQTVTLRESAALVLATDQAKLEQMCLINKRNAKAVVADLGVAIDNAAAATPDAIEAKANRVGVERRSAQTILPFNASTDLCLAANWQAQGLTEASLTINRLPLALLRRWLKDEVDIEGFVRGNGSLYWPVGESLNANLTLAAQDTVLVYGYGEDTPERYPVDNLQLSATAKAQQLNADVGLTFVNYGVLQGTFNADTKERELSGNVAVNLDNLSPLEALLPSVSNIHGSLNGALNIAGTLDAPSASVDLTLANAELELPALGVNITALNATVAGDQQNLLLEAHASAGDGTLQATAQAHDLLLPSWRVEANVTGERAKLMATSALTLLLTPEIAIKVDADTFDVSGSAKVPEAYAVISTLPVSATKVSDDVIVIDSDNSVKKTPGMALHLNLDVALGDKVNLDAAGFKARIGGNLSLNKVPARAMYAVGNINIIDGSYKSLGQDLSIEKGTLSFQGPMDDPGLNVTATRAIEDVTVGLIIGGTLQRPVTEIFSRPQVSDSNAMSLLFTGKPLDGASSGEGAGLISAIAKLGIKRGQFLADDIAGRFGLDELTIKADDDVKDSRLWLGKYITEDLYVHYAIGLFDSLSSVGLTYFLNDNFRIEAESGEVQSADLMFRMER